MSTISGPVPYRLRFLDWIRCAAIITMIIHHYHYIPLRVQEGVMSDTSVQNIPKWVDACGIFARNTFVALMGISLVLSYRSIYFNVRSKKVRRYIQKKLRRFWYLIISAVTIQLASGILMGEDLAIRFGIIHFAACVAFLGSIVGGILIHLSLIHI